MSTEIDTKVVDMRFDNAEFESNVKESISSIKKLKKGLDFSNVTNSFKKIEDAAKSVDISALSNAVDTITVRFDAMGLAAVQSITNIMNSVEQAGIQLVKSLSVDNIAAGWQKFANETTSVGTLSAQGYNINTVTEQLKRLNWYTDETSYNFTEMVSNIAKFTATGKGLEDSVTAMEGIANWAALSGQNASVASRAMYQLSQAMGAGVMRLIDYKSIQNMSMDTAEFRQKALDAGVALGTLKKNANGTYQSLVATTKAGSAAFTKSQFAENLSQGKWFTSDVMMKVYKDYSAAVDDIYKYADEKGITASQAMKELNGKVDEFGMKAFRAAQEARTWADTVDAVKDAVSTGWMNTFENIFGNYEEAKELWTDLANELYDVFAEGGNARNEILEEWKDKGGRDNFIDAFWRSFHTLVKIIDLVKESFHNVFPQITAQRLLHITRSIQGLTAVLSINQNESEVLTKIFTGLFDVIDLGVKAVESIVKGFYPLIGAFDRFMNNTDNGAVKLSEFITVVHDAVIEFGVFDEITNSVSDALAILIGYFTKLISNNINDFFVGFSKNGSVLSGILYVIAGNIGNLIRMTFELISALTGIDLSGVRDIVLDKFIKLIAFLENTISSINVSSLKKIAGDIKQFFIGLADSVTGLNTTFPGFKDFISNLSQYFSGLGDVFMSPSFDKIWTILQSGGLLYLVYQLNTFIDSLGSIGTGLIFGGNLQESITNALDMFGQVRVNTLEKIAISIGVMTASLIALSMLDTERLATAITGIGGSIAGLLVIINKLMGVSAIDDLATYSALSTLMASVAAGIFSMAISMRIIDGMDTMGIIKSLGAIGGLMAGFVILIDKLSIMAAPTELLKAAATFIIMATALNMLIPPMLVFGNMPVESIGKAMLALGGFAGLLALITTGLTADLKGAATFTVMATALNMLIPPLLVFGNMPVESIGKAMLVLGGFAGLLALITTGLSADLKGAATFTVMALALNMLIPPLITFSNIPIDTMGVALLEIAGFIGVLSAIMKVLNENIVGAATFTVMALALNMLIPPLITFSNIPIDTMGVALLEIAGFIGVLAAELGVMNANIAGAASLLVASAAIAVFAGAFVQLGKMNLTQIGLALVGMLTTIGLISGVVALIAAFSPAITAALPVLLGVSAAVLGLGLGLNLLTSAMTVFAASGAGAIDALIKLLEALDELIPVVVRITLDLGIKILEMVRDQGAKIADVLVEAAAALLVEISKQTGPIVQACVDIVIEILNGLADSLVDPENAARMRAAVDHFLWNMFDAVLVFLGINSPSTKFTWVGEMCVEGFKNGFIGTFLSQLSEYRELGKKMISEWADGVKENYEAGWKIIEEWVDGVINKAKKITESGKNIINGLTDGLEMAADDPVGFMKGYGQYLVDTFNKSAGVSSPSTKMISSGGFIIGGLLDGLSRNRDSVIDAMSTLGTDTIAAFNDECGIHSDSDEMIDSGKHLINGAKTGIENNKEGLFGSIKKVGSDVIGYFKDSVNYDAGYNATFSFLSGSGFAVNQYAEYMATYNQKLSEYRRQLQELDQMIMENTTKFGYSSFIVQDLMRKRNQIQKAMESFQMSMFPKKEEEEEETLTETLTETGTEAGEEAGKAASKAFWANFKLPDGSIFNYKFSSWDAYVEAGNKIGGFDNVAKAAFETYNDEDQRTAFQSWDDDAREAMLNSAKSAYDKFFKEFKEGTITAAEYETKFTKLLKRNAPVKDDLLKYTAEQIRNYTTDALDDVYDEYTKSLENIQEKMNEFAENIASSWGDIFEFIDTKEYSDNLRGSFSEFINDLHGSIEEYKNGVIYPVSDLFSDLSSSAISFGEKFKITAGDLVSEIIESGNEAREAFKDFADGLHLGMEDALSSAADLENDYNSRTASFASSMQKSMTSAFKFKTNAEYLDELNTKLDEAKEQYGEDSSQVRTLTNKINSFSKTIEGKENEIYSVNAAEAGKKKTPFGDEIVKETDMLKKYSDIIKSLRQKGLPSDVVEMLSDMGREEGMAAAEYLSNLSDQAYQKFLDDWYAHKAAASDLGETLYEGSKETIDDILTKDRIALEEYDDELEYLLQNHNVSDELFEMLKGMSREDALGTMRYLNDLTDSEYNSFLAKLDSNEKYSLEVASKLYSAEARTMDEKFREEAELIDEYNENFSALIEKGVSADILDMIKELGTDEASVVMSYLTNMSESEYKKFEQTLAYSKKASKQMTDRMIEAEARTIRSRMSEETKVYGEYSTEFAKLMTLNGGKGVSSDILEMIKGLGTEEAVVTMKYLNGLTAEEYQKFENSIKANKKAAEKMSDQMIEADAKKLDERLKTESKELTDYNTALGELMKKDINSEVVDMIAGMSREEGLATIKYLNSLSDQEFEALMKTWENNKKKAEKAADTLYGKSSGSSVARFKIDMTEGTKELENYRDQLNKLFSEKGVDKSLVEYIGSLDRKEGLALVEWLNNLSPEELKNVVDRWKNNKSISEEISETLYSDEVKDANTKLVNDISNTLRKLPESALETGKETAKELMRGISEESVSMLDTIDETINNLCDRIERTIDKRIKTIKAMGDEVAEGFKAAKEKMPTPEQLDEADKKGKNTVGTKGISIFGKSMNDAMNREGLNVVKAAVLSSEAVQRAMNSDASSVTRVRSNKVTWDPGKHIWVKDNTASDMSNIISNRIDTSATNSDVHEIKAELGVVRQGLDRVSAALETMPEELSSGFNMLGDAFGNAKIMIDPVSASDKLAPYMSGSLGRIFVQKRRNV